MIKLRAPSNPTVFRRSPPPPTYEQLQAAYERLWNKYDAVMRIALGDA